MREVLKWTAMVCMVLAVVSFYSFGLTIPDWRYRMVTCLWLLAVGAGGWIRGYDHAKLEPWLGRGLKSAKDSNQP